MSKTKEKVVVKKRINRFKNSLEIFKIFFRDFYVLEMLNRLTAQMKEKFKMEECKVRKI